MGHGKRWRDVILPEKTVVTAWIWRFLCCRCERTCSVSPDEILARHRYTLAAILVAWFLSAPRPIGDNEDDEAVYALVGVDRRVLAREFRAGKRRWRSLSRWTDSIPTWWPSRPVVGATWRQRATALIAGFIHGDGERDGAIRRALAAHTAGGRPM